MKTFVGELKRRNVFRVGLTYLVVAWLVVQIVNNLVPILNAPDWVAKVVLIFLVAGFPISLVLAWAVQFVALFVVRLGLRVDAGWHQARHRACRCTYDTARLWP